MSHKSEDRIKKGNYYEEVNSTRSSAKNDYCNMNIATFTFGGRQNNLQMHMCDKESRDAHTGHGGVCSSTSTDPAVVTPNSNSNMNANANDYPHSLNSNVCNINSNPSPKPYIINKIGSHNSFLVVVIHTFYNLKELRNYILEEMRLSDKDTKNKLLVDLRNVISKYSQGLKVDVSKLRISLADQFQNRRKFLLEQPDDPLDCYFAFLNAIHSYKMDSPLNEVVDNMCTSTSTKCVSHKNFWIDLCRIDECECKGSSKRYYSNHNYIFDIPLQKLFEMSNNMNLVEMSKSFKLKTGKFSEVGSTEMSSISDLKGKLFSHFKMLLNQVKVECPAKGIRCEVNKTTKSFYLAKIPSYLAFNLQKNIGLNNNNNSGINSNNTPLVTEILKTFILIPHIFELGTIFDHSSKQKVFFEFYGAILLKPSKTYSCFFKSSNNNNSDNEDWVHYDDHNITHSSWFDLISLCLKSCEVPVLLFYQIQDKYASSLEKEITIEEIQILERYVRTADNLANILANRFRSNEEVIKFDNIRSSRVSESSQQKLKINNSSNNISNVSKGASTGNNSTSSSRNGALTEYSCSSCFTKNRIECPICYKCNKNNESVIEDLLKKRGMNNFINIANFNVNINTGNSAGNSGGNSDSGNSNVNSNATRNNNSLTNQNNHINRESLADRERDKDSKTNSIKRAPHMPNPFAEKKVNNYVEENSTDEEDNRNNTKSI